MGGIAQIFSKPNIPKAPPAPKVPDYEAERKKAEAEALQKRAALADKGMAGAVLGGSTGDSGAVNRKKLLGE